MERFLTVLNYGWCNVSIGDYESRASYLTDVPLDCLSSALDYLLNEKPIELHFDAEGWDFDIYSDDQKTILKHTQTDEAEPVEIEIEGVRAFDLAVQIYHDIAENIDGWYSFLFDASMSSRHTLLFRLKLLKYLIEESGKQCILTDVGKDKSLGCAKYTEAEIDTGLIPFAIRHIFHSKH